MIQKLSMFLLTICCLYFPAQAQSWQWGRPISFDSSEITHAYFTWRGNISIGNHGFFIGSTTDQAGNIYSLFNVGKMNLKIAGQPDTAFGKGDILLTSFSCDGRYRWSQVIGSSADSDVALSIKASAESGVFVMGLLNMAAPGGAHFGKDTTIANTNRTMFLAKYDTAGNFQWVRLPQPDTISKYSAWFSSQPANMDLGSDGTIYLLTCLSPGAYAGGNYVVNSQSIQVLKYGSNGQFLGGLALPIYNYTPYTWYYIRGGTGLNILSDGTNNRLIISGGAAEHGAFSIGGTTLGINSYFVASFNANNGGLIWLKASNPEYYDHPFMYQTIFNAGPILDAQGNVYVTGATQDSAFFNGVLFRNPWHSLSNFVMKMDANTGLPLWTTINRIGTNNSTITNLALTGQKLAITGFYNDSLIFPNALLTNNPSVDSDDVYIVQMDANTGAVQKMASLTGSSRTSGSFITADRRGNFYVTGSYSLA
ncbi:MAG: hypothetical protein JST27_03360, partial [Bacteroidetes bacterium]|nr:hypothetical protein [Bacteroidota bacterium]